MMIVTLVIEIFVGEYHADHVSYTLYMGDEVAWKYGAVTKRNSMIFFIKYVELKFTKK